MRGGTVRPMKTDTAIRFAASAENGVTVAQTQHIVAEYLKYVARCPVCENEGRFTFGRDVNMRMRDTYKPNEALSERTVVAGTEAPCPRCGGPDEDGTVRGDPNHVAWHCLQGDTDTNCRFDRNGDLRRREGHEGCGWRIILPLDWTADDVG